jgi:hypothetical protein
LRRERLRVLGIETRGLGLGAGARQRRRRLGARRLVGARVDLEQRLALGHLGALADQHAGDEPARLCGDFGALERLHRAGGLDLVGHAPAHDQRHRDRHALRAAAAPGAAAGQHHERPGESPLEHQARVEGRTAQDGPGGMQPDVSLRYRAWLPSPQGCSNGRRDARA